jgi:formylglycine-generating enzyme required for sulfatase activity
MKNEFGKSMPLAFVLIGAMWLVPTAARAVSAAATGDDIPYIQMPLSEPEEALPVPGTAPENCGRCHNHPEKLKTNIKDPSCLECHMPDDERIQADPRPAAAAMAVPVKLEPAVKTTEMIHIPAGVFLMGRSVERTSTEGRGNDDETPEHQVYVPGFYMDKYETTNIQYKAFLDASGIKPPRNWRGGNIPPGKDHHPVNYVSWFEANDYCHWVGKRLPTEAEWEKGARGTKGLHFPWGNTFDPMKANTPQHWLALDKKGDTMPVGSFENGKSPFGLYDMAGNLYEWTSSWYKPYPHNNKPNAHYGYKNKIVRGGSWYDCLSYGCGLSAPTFNRTRFAPIIRNKSFGFRCAKSESSH